MFKVPIEKLNGINLHYEVYGSGEPIILIMGFGAQGNEWYPQIELFAKEFQVINFDNRGVGQSERPNYHYSMEEFVADIVALMDFLHISSAHICGISMGGMIGLQLTLAHPERVRRLTLLAITPFGTDVNTLLTFIEQGEGAPAEVRAKATAQMLFSSSYQEKLMNDKTLWAKFMQRFTENPTNIQDYRNQAAAIRAHNVLDRLG